MEMANCDAQRLPSALGGAHMGGTRRATQDIPPAVRRRVLRRDHGRCVVPGCTHGTFLDVHHLRRRSEGGTHHDDNLVTLVKAVDEVQKNNKNLGTVVVGVSGVQAADFEKIQTTHKLTTPLTVAVDKDGPAKYELNKEAAVTVLVYKKGGAITKSFAFKDTKSAAEKAKDIAAAATAAVK